MLGMVKKMKRTGCIAISGHGVDLRLTNNGTIVGTNELSFHSTPTTMRYTFYFNDNTSLKMSKARFELLANSVKCENILADGFDGFRS